jgi:TRAP-type uncharacterized transport system substrate-binding protein
MRPANYRRPLPALLGVVALAALAGVGWALAGRPPRAIVLATGPEGGSYQAYGARYRELAAREGLEVQLRPTAGDVENLALLRDPRSGVSAAFLQSGTTTAAQSPELVSLGTLYYQAIWLFRRGGQPQGSFFGGPRVSIGPEGSGTRAVATRLLGLVGHQDYDFLDWLPHRAAAELMAGRIDGMVLVAGWDSPLVRKLLDDPGVELLSVVRADAIVALDPFLEKLVLPMGVADLPRNRPPRDVQLLATKASLVVRSGLNAAVQNLLLEAASEIHGPPSIFSRAGRFPAAEGVDVPLGDVARQFYRSGRPFLQRYLPYWMAVMAERLVLVLVPLLGILVPVVRAVPGLYQQLLLRRVTAFYGELKLIETELERREPGGDTADLARRTAELETRASHARVPIAYSPLIYTLKQHIRLVQTRLGAPSR